MCLVSAVNLIELYSVHLGIVSLFTYFQLHAIEYLEKEIGLPIGCDDSNEHTPDLTCIFEMPSEVGFCCICSLIQ